MLDGNSNTQEDQILSRRKAARMLIAIVIMFAICYLPVQVMGLLRYFGVIIKDGTVGIVHALIIHWLLQLSCQPGHL
ncbi:hypothetical protein Btru_010331 [Bulinus truncatus]|nr:hypothetical protein Btru_010331 [Bulinus truncatus]